jgi:hypothetical protein
MIDMLFVNNLLLLVSLIFSIYKLINYFFENYENSEFPNSLTYYGKVTVLRITMSSSNPLNDPHKFAENLAKTYNCNQIYMNNYGEFYLIYYKCAINANNIINSLMNDFEFNIPSQRSSCDSLFDSFNVSGFCSRTEFLSYMSRCVNRSAQHFLEDYFNKDELCGKEVDYSSEFAFARLPSGEDDSDDSGRPRGEEDGSEDGEGEYTNEDSGEDDNEDESYDDNLLDNSMFNTAIALARFEDETEIDVENYNDNLWGTWIKFDTNYRSTHFSGFPINHETEMNVLDFVMSSSLSRTYELTEKERWFQTYGSIYSPFTESSTESSPESSVENEIENNHSEEVLKYVNMEYDEPIDAFRPSSPTNVQNDYVNSFRPVTPINIPIRRKPH